MPEKERPLIQKALDEMSHPDGGGNLCASFEVPGERKIWIQSLVDTLNLYWPHNENPMLALGKLELTFPPHFELTTWEPNTYATFSFRPTNSEDYARFLDDLFLRVYDCSSDGYPLNVTVHPI